MKPHAPKAKETPIQVNNPKSFNDFEAIERFLAMIQSLETFSWNSTLQTKNPAGQKPRLSL